MQIIKTYRGRAYSNNNNNRCLFDIRKTLFAACEIGQTNRFVARTDAVVAGQNIRNIANPFVTRYIIFFIFII